MTLQYYNFVDGGVIQNMNEMKPLTERQRQVLSAIEWHIKEKGYPPTVKELADTLGICSVSAVYAHLQRLKKKGYITSEPNKPRTIVPVAKS